MGARGTLSIGKLGEDLACRYLLDSNCSILARNYRKPWGEIDIVARERNVIVFAEVKAMIFGDEVSRATSGYSPEDNLAPWKKERLERVMKSYIAEHNLDNGQTEWRIDYVFVDIIENKTCAHIRHRKDL